MRFAIAYLLITVSAAGAGWFLSVEPSLLMRGGGLTVVALVVLVIYFATTRGRVGTVLVGAAASLGGAALILDFIWQLFLKIGIDLRAWEKNLVNPHLVAPLMALFIGAAVGRFAMSPYWSRRLMIRSGQYERAKSDEHGSADLMTTSEIKALTKGPGYICGEYRGDLVRLDTEKHILTVAPPRSGKGVSLIMPFLLTYTGPIIGVDIKGENAAVTARARRDMEHTVVILNPYSIAGLPNEWHFNPLDCIRLGPTFSRDVEAVTEAMIVEQKGKEHPHFSDTLRITLGGLIAWVAATERGAKRNLGRLFELVNETPQQILDEVILPRMAAQPQIGDGLPAQAAHMILGVAVQERGSFWSTLRRQIAFIQEPMVREMLSRSDFSFDDVTAGHHDIFVVVPDDALSKQSRLIRLVVNLAIKNLKDGYPERVPPQRLVLVLDELPVYGGGLRAITKEVGLSAGFGLTVWAFAQNLGQLTEEFGKEGAETFRAGAGIVHYFQVARADQDTAELVSKLLGETTVKVHTHNAGSGSRQSERNLLGERTDNLGVSEGVLKRRLMTPQEVQEMDPNKLIVFTTGRRPAILDRVFYFKRRDMARRADPNPYMRK